MSCTEIQSFPHSLVMQTVLMPFSKHNTNSGDIIVFISYMKGVPLPVCVCMHVGGGGGGVVPGYELVKMGGGYTDFDSAHIPPTSLSPNELFSIGCFFWY